MHPGPPADLFHNRDATREVAVAKKRQLTPAPDIGDWPVYRWLSEQYGEDKPVRKALQAKYKATLPEFGQLLREITTKHSSQLRIAFLQLISEPWKVSSKIPGGPNPVPVKM